MMHLPDPVPEPGHPNSPEPSAHDLLNGQTRIAQVLLDARVDHRGIRADLLARLTQGDVSGLTDAVAEWCVYDMLRSNLLRLVVTRPRPSPHSGGFYAGPPGVPPPISHVFVPFSEQIVAPTAELWRWLRNQRPQASEALNEREEKILRALLRLGAAGERTRVPRRRAAREAEPEDKPASFNHTFVSLGERGLVCSRTGPGGGIWLTKEGMAAAKALASRN
jgi:hypothetical protein